jgi:hypothetical protein
MQRSEAAERAMLLNNPPEGRKVRLGDAVKVNKLRRSSVASVRGNPEGTGGLCVAMRSGDNKFG